MKKYVARSKLSGDFFKYIQYTDDGWGKYEDTVSMIEFTKMDDMPSILDEYQLKNNSGDIFKNHKREDVQFIEIISQMKLKT